MALGTRAIGLGGAVTEDEDQWIARSGTFARALAGGDWPRTYLTGHPGVTTMWLTTLTLGVERTSPFARGAGAPDVTTEPDFLPALQRARVPFAVLQAGLVVVAAVLAGRLLGPTTGLVAGLLLAAEPFWSGVGPVVGMDGLLTGFLTVSLLALLVAGAFGSVGAAILSGAAFGLAFLTKTTALFLGPVVGAVLLVVAWRSFRGRFAAASVTTRRWWLLPLLLGLLWAASAALTIWLVWPAAWLSPVATVRRAVEFSARLGGTPHAPGNFLLGEPVDDPGLLFYPVALLARIGPGTLVGLLLVFLFGAPRRIWPALFAVLGYVALFLALLALASKKVDRYLLPILPALGVLAAVGFVQAARRLRAYLTPPAPLSGAERGETAVLLPPLRAGEGGRGGEVFFPVLLAGLAALAIQLWPLVLAGPFPLAAYNPLVGGARFAERAIPVGWGDGLDVAAEHIREMAGGRTVVTAIWSPLRVSFGAHAPGPVISERQIARADFYVDYVHARQRRTTPRQLLNRPPDAVVTIGGVDYARIYRLR